MNKFILLCFAVFAVSLAKRKASQLYFSSYVLYTRDNHKSGEKVDVTAASVAPLLINYLTDCVIIVHGYPDKGNNAMSLVLRDAFLTSKQTNVIVVDWTVAASNNMAGEAVPSVADNVVELIKLLLAYAKIQKPKLHLVGFDLGAHVVGNIGRNIKDVARITALNPFGGDEWMLSAYHLRSSDALYVEVIHTEVSQIGLPVAVGDVDFFPQGGVRQPGCRDVQCSHRRSWELFAASLTHGGLIGYRCDSMQEALDIGGSCKGFALSMGNNSLVKYGNGIFRLETSAVYPYRCRIRCGIVDNLINYIEYIGNRLEGQRK